jgi:hypothetical protein
MKIAFGVVALCLTLSACGPSAYEQAKRTQLLAKCGKSDTFDQQCSDAYDLIAGPGQGAKEKELLDLTKRNQGGWSQPELRVVPGSGIGTTPAYEQARQKASLAKCSQGATFDQECSDAFDVVFKAGAGAQQRALLLQESSAPKK